MSHGIGVGGRDLDERVGALGMLVGDRRRSSRPGDQDAGPHLQATVAARVAKCRARARSPVEKTRVVCFLGSNGSTLTEAAEQAMGRKARRPKRRAAGRAKGTSARASIAAARLPPRPRSCRRRGRVR